MPVLEIFNFQASAAFLNNPSILMTSLNVLLSITGVERVYYGFQQGTTRLWVTVFWDHYESHLALMNNTAVYGPFIERLRVCWPQDEIPIAFHVQFASDPIPAFDSANTGILNVSLLKLPVTTSGAGGPGHGGHDHWYAGGAPLQSQEQDSRQQEPEGLESVVTKIMNILRALTGGKPPLPTSGPTLESPDLHVVLTGWTIDKPYLPVVQETLDKLDATEKGWNVEMAQIRFTRAMLPY